jgi:hypothetical protein
MQYLSLDFTKPISPSYAQMELQLAAKAFQKTSTHFVGGEV